MSRFTCNSRALGGLSLNKAHSLLKVYGVWQLNNGFVLFLNKCLLVLVLLGRCGFGGGMDGRCGGS